MNFLERIQNFLAGNERLPSVKRWIADPQSWYHAPLNFPYSVRTEECPTLKWKPLVENSTDALIVIFLGLFRPEWELWEIIERISYLCYRYRYQGRWEQVQVFLEQVTDLPTFLDCWQKYHHPNEFFGSFLFNCQKFLERNLASLKREEIPSVVLPRPTKKVWRRGYQDKGNLRPLHKRGRSLGDPEPGLDRRSKVRYSHPPGTDLDKEVPERE